MKPRSYLFEIPILYLALIAVEKTLIPEHLAFQGMAPHPYWMGPFLFGLRYGLPAGWMAGGVAACVYLGNIWLFGERYNFEDAGFYVLPGLFAVGGFALGAAAERFKITITQTQHQLNESLAHNARLRKELDTQKEINRAVEQHVVTQMSSLVTLYHGARNLSKLDRNALTGGILDFFSDALKASKASIYLKQNDQWVLRAQRGWTETDKFSQRIGLTEGLIGKSGSENKVVNLRDWSDSDGKDAWEQRENLDAIMAAPLRQASQMVIGVYAVQQIPFLRFNSSSVNLLTLLADWAQMSISHSLYVEELKSKSVHDEVFNVYNEQYFHHRLRQEFERSRSYALPLSLLTVSIRGLTDLPPDNRINFLRAVGQLLTQTCRPIDVVARTGNDAMPFSVILMTASLNQARDMKDKILSAYDVLDLKRPPPEVSNTPFELKIGLSTFDPQMTDIEHLIERAKDGLR